ncbi:MAG: UDP-N-acetylmuramoyl-L-alanyl-D-glutamate--2,6-diaminopimelate ligase [Bacilli bacterium]|nr:UDP-N-acetylmuramoyl-L-alanyl-D-glutamate--2,6-diaminopimelate ligase [Bacilli bacterium]
MRLENVFDNLNVKFNNNIEINGISIDSRTVKEGYLFIAINGFDMDGHNFINSAIENGATAILIDEDRLDEFKDLNVEIITTPNTRELVSLVSCNFYNNPSREFKLIGITGTKGKTTTTFMVKRILEEAGYKVGLVGTVANYIGKEKLEDADRTTPEPTKLQELFRMMADAKCDYVIMEVSSQSLKLGRVNGSCFDVGLFTNLSEDHISEKEHPTMEDYFLSKSKLFDKVKNGFTNVDDIKGKELISLKPNCNFKTYSVNEKSDKQATNIRINNVETRFNCLIDNEDTEVVINIPGGFTVYNALGAISICEYYRVKKEDIVSALKTVSVPGRSELVPNKLGLALMIDYAHSEESLENILSAVKSYTKGRVISVFGCGGDRDNRKRPKMGIVSGKIADYTIVTSDNPRTEDPELIVREIEDGIKTVTDKYEVVVDRTKAIEKAIKMATKEDLVVFAGKGHETYQEINHIKHPYDERIIINEIIKKM